MTYKLVASVAAKTDFPVDNISQGKTMLRIFGGYVREIWEIFEGSVGHVKTNVWLSEVWEKWLGSGELTS